MAGLSGDMADQPRPQDPTLRYALKLTADLPLREGEQVPRQGNFILEVRHCKKAVWRGEEW
jgi:hypothetical protein